MNSTPLSAKLLAGALTLNSWTQAELATAAGVSQAIISLHLTGTRPIRDDHMAAYAAALPRDDLESFVAAWLQDVLPPAAQEIILSTSTCTLSEAVKSWRPGLDEEQKHMIDWWASKLAADPELDGIFRSISRKAGWQYPT